MNIFYSKIGQDKWVLDRHDNKTGGFFVDIGAHDGIELSNTYTLEKDFGWYGICVEANPESFIKLKENRTCSLENSPVLDTSGITVPFYAHEEDPMLSAVAPFGYVKDYDNNCFRYPQHHLTTISLNNLLQKHGAPSTIDYISIDVEGFEKEILETFNFTEYDIKCWTVEANGPDTELILDMFKHENYTTELRSWDIFVWR